MHWKTELARKDRAWNKVQSNFHELFHSIQQAGIPAEIAFTVVPKAVKAHLPSPQTQRSTYSMLANSKGSRAPKFETYVKRWAEGIEEKAYMAFYMCFPQLDPLNTPLDQEDDVSLGKMYGNMSEKEYRLQREYAESFPVLDTSELEKQLFSSNLLDVELDNILGGKDEAK